MEKVPKFSQTVAIRPEGGELPPTPPLTPHPGFPRTPEGSGKERNMGRLPPPPPPRMEEATKRTYPNVEKFQAECKNGIYSGMLYRVESGGEIIYSNEKNTNFTIC